MFKETGTPTMPHFPAFAFYCLDGYRAAGILPHAIGRLFSIPYTLLS